MKSTIKCIIASATLAAALTACSDDSFNSNKSTGRAITFKRTTWSAADKSRSDSNQHSYLNLRSTHLSNSAKWLIAAEEEGIDNSTLYKKQPLSRGEMVTASNFYSKFDVYAYSYSADFNSLATAANNATIFINKAIAQKNSDDSSDNEIWTTNPTYYWQKQSSRISFFGVAPSTEDFSDYTVSTSVDNPHIAYTVPTSVEDQPDLLLAEKTCLGDGSENENVTLPFNHLLTAIKVKVSVSTQSAETFAKSIQTVSIKHVKNSGTYNLASNTVWTLGDTYAEFTTSVPSDTEVSNNEYALADGVNTFMMMPQAFSDNADAAIEVTLNDGSKLTCSLNDAGLNWTAGKTITYFISDSRDKVDYILDVPETIYFSWDKDSKNCPIYSYKKITKTDGSNETTTSHLEWEAVVSNVTPNFVESPSAKVYGTGTDTFTGDPTADNITINTNRVNDKEIDISNSEDVKTLQSADIVGSNSSKTEYYDLSTNQTGSDASNRHTANCYIVNAPGYYRIPLVYGNAIKNGAYQTTAYYNSSSSSYYLSRFVEHRGDGIKDPWITYWKGWSGYKPTSAKVLWQDANNLIKNSSISVGDISNHDDYIYFTVEDNEDTLVPGNVVIVLLDEYSVPMWSWHIWITPLKSSETITFQNGGGGTSTFLKYPLGYINEPTRHYPERKADLVITQKDGSYVTISKTVLLIQEKHDFSPISAPYYQFGRMVPFPGAICSEVGGLDDWNSYQYDMEDKPCYDGNGYAYSMSDFIQNGATTNIKYAIQNPDVFYAAGQLYWATSDVYFNLWGCASNGNQVSSYKTVYDPCPPGFKVPPLLAYPSLIYDNLNHSTDKTELADVIESEFDLFNYSLNTPFTSHLDYINYFGFKFYLNQMTVKGKKAVTDDTFLFPALGFRIASEAEITSAATFGQTRTLGGTHNMGGYFYYWSSSQNVFSTTSYHSYFPQGGYILGNTSVNPLSYSIRPSRGMPVWPMLGN